jgi:hypothetical protein
MMIVLMALLWRHVPSSGRAGGAWERLTGAARACMCECVGCRVSVSCVVCVWWTAHRRARRRRVGRVRACMRDVLCPPHRVFYSALAVASGWCGPPRRVRETPSPGTPDVCVKCVSTRTRLVE